MAKPFRIQGVIGDDFQTADLQAFLDAAGGAAVDIEINSPGGSVFEGLSAYNALAEYQGLVTITNTALAASAASLIFMGGDRRLMLDGSMLMVHRSSGLTVGNTDAHDKTAAVLAKIDQQVINIYSKTSGLPPSRVKALLDDETWMDASQAVKLGFATEASVEAVSAHIAGFDLTQYRHPPARLVALASPVRKGKPPMAKKPVLDDDDDTVVVDTTGDILARCAAADLSAKATADIVLKAKNDLNAARDLIITAVAAKSGDQRNIQLGNDAGGDETAFNEAMADAFQAKLQGRPAAGAGKAFNGMTSLDLAKEFMRTHNITLRARDPASIFSAAFKARQPFMSAGFESTSDLGSLLGDGMNRELSRLYAAAEPGSVAIAGAGSVNDYRTKTIVTTSSFPSLEKVLESGEITWSSISDHGEELRVANYARAIAVSIEVLTNDDLGGVQRAIRDISVATQNLRAKLVLDALTTTVMADGYALIDDAHHHNVVSAGAPSVAALSAMRAKLRLQTGLDGQTVLGLTPKTILVPAALETEAEIVAAAIAATTVSEVNPFSNLTVAVDPRLDAIDADAWYVTADATVNPAIELDTLTSTPQPRLEVADPASFDRLGTAFRVWFAVGAAPIEFRSIVKNTG